LYQLLTEKLLNFEAEQIMCKIALAFKLTMI